MKEVVFPPKVSGFYRRKEGPPTPLSIEGLTQSLQSIFDKMQVQWQFIDMTSEPDYSYHCCHFIYEGEDFFFFMNKYYHLAAFSKIEDIEAWKSWEKGKLLPRNHYADIPTITASFNPPWTVIPEQMLIQPVDADNEVSQKIVMNLQNDEFAEFAYWEPQNMGNILFNNWEKY